MASILCIGTELTIGQITNGNAATLSAQLTSEFGCAVNAHLVVPDHRKSILQGLDYLAKTEDLIITTGGLGPTTDDFTREVINDWCKTELRFEKKIWAELVERLQARKVQVRDSHRRQCFFPVGAKILKNTTGTAHGFYLRKKHKSKLIHIIVLPGPPSEIESIWQNDLCSLLKKLLLKSDKWHQSSWDLLGLPESEVAEKVQTLAIPRHIDIGYRVHAPYVELKIRTSTPNSKPAMKKAVKSVEDTFSEWIVGRDSFDVVKELQSLIPRDQNISIYAQGPFYPTLVTRLLPLTNSHNISFRAEPLEKKLHSANHLSIHPKSENVLAIGCGNHQSHEVSDFQMTAWASRSNSWKNAYVVESALLFWLGWLSQ